MSLTLSKLAGLIDAKVVLPPEGPHHLGQAVGRIRFRWQEVEEGDIFCAVKGAKADGLDFALDACGKGAKAIISDRQIPGLSCIVLLVEDVRKAMAIAATLEQSIPSGDLNVIGVTGTNGKTTVSQLIAAILAECGQSVGTIGTLGADIAGKHVDTEHTTPEAPIFQGLIAQARDAEVESLVCEVSSHALDLERTWGTEFEIAVFTNLSQDHLDYHEDMRAYFRSKARLFLEYDPEKRVVCIDDDWGRRLAALCGEWALKTVTVGRSGADMTISDVEHTPTGTAFSISTKAGKHTRINTPLIGSYNVQNAALAYTTCVLLGVDQNEVARALGQAPQVPGRLELVEKDIPIKVYVDYAHTPDALGKSIEAIQETRPSRLITVFGCGGDRDRKKRPLMGEAASGSQIVLVTSDNPRTEDPNLIIDDIMTGILPASERTGTQVIRQVDRPTAIKNAIEMAEEGDAILIAGKGHEDYQIVGTEKLHMDDREMAHEALKARGFI